MCLTRVAMEMELARSWISEQLQELRHEVIVANVGELREISHSAHKSSMLRSWPYARLDLNIVRLISYRTVEQQEALRVSE